MIWLDYFIPLSCGVGGVVCGWIMHVLSSQGAPPQISSDRERDANGSTADAESQANSSSSMEAKQQRIAVAAERLQSYAKTMAADVDAHQTRVQEVNHTLTTNQTQSPEAVSEAIHELIAANETMQEQLQDAHDRIHEQTMRIETAERRAETDALTLVPNRAAFDRHLSAQHARGPCQKGETDKAGSLAMLDVDHFKKFNDVYGHRAGDEVLRVVAGMLHSRLNKHGLVARYGGEEFAVILDGVDVETASELVESARKAISKREIIFEGTRLRVTASVGVAELEKAETIENWVQRADDGLYRSKEHGRDCGHRMNSTQATLIEGTKRIDLSSPDPLAAQTSTPSGSNDDESSDDLESLAIDLDDIAPLGDDAMTGDDASEETETNKAASANAETESDTVLTGPLASLPNREALRESFDEILERGQSSASLSMMAIQCHGESNATSMRSLLQIVRATLRSVDRLGYADASTLLVCMPSVDQATAQSRGQQICRSASAIGLKQSSADEHAISIGIAPANAESDFDEIVDVSLETAGRGKNADADQVIFAGEPASV